MIRKKIDIIIQSRIGSKRLPNKVLKKIKNFNITECLIKRLENTNYVSDLIFAIPDNKDNDKLFKFLKNKKCKIYRGSEKNVLERYYKAAKENKSDIIIRITGDCPFVDRRLVEGLIKKYILLKPDYLSNISPPTFPDGLDVEIFSFKALDFANKNANTLYEKEHVTTKIRNSNKFKIKNISNNEDLSFIKISIDTQKDFLKIKKIFSYFKYNMKFSYKKLLERKNINKLFRKDILNKNYNINKTKQGQSLWKKAKTIIPGGNMILSKNPERFLPDYWPTYYKKAKGCKITDLDGNEYLDFSLMGVGTNVLGYANKHVDNQIKKTIYEGNMSTLNSKEEVLLAEKLIEIHPWFNKVKFARTGGEANAIAIRIARAASGKDNVAFCGYHGWHDWYLSSNLSSKKTKNLDQHLLKGLEINGVPQKLSKTSFTFEYGNKVQLSNLISKRKIGVIKMEVCRNTKPDLDFLNFVQKIAKKNGIVLIFDECTTGFRETLGGLHTSINIKPDISIFGKALGNGYAITAIVGKSEVMESANKSFISSTFWSERIGFTAALKTIEIMEKNKTWITISKIGKRIQEQWKKIADDNRVDIDINGIYSLSSFKFNSSFHQEYKTLITQEMLKSNILASNVIYPSISHTEKLTSIYFEKLNEIFKIIKKCDEGSDIRKYLKSRISLKDFKRLN